MIPASVLLVHSLWKRSSFKLPFIKNICWSSDLLFCKYHLRFKCWKVKLDSFFILTTGRISGSQKKMLKWQIVRTLGVPGWVSRVVLTAGVRSLAPTGTTAAWGVQCSHFSSSPGSWSRVKGYPCWHAFLSVVGLGVCEEGRSAWRRRRREKKDWEVQLYWPNPQVVRKCMYFYRIRTCRNVLHFFYTHLLLMNKIPKFGRYL